MHTVQLLDEALQLAERLGYQVRLEPLGGHAGACIVAGRKLLLLDMEAGPAERLDTALDALRDDAGATTAGASPSLARLLASPRRAA